MNNFRLIISYHTGYLLETMLVSKTFNKLVLQSERIKKVVINKITNILLIEKRFYIMDKYMYRKDYEKYIPFLFNIFYSDVIFDLIIRYVTIITLKFEMFNSDELKICNILSQDKRIKERIDEINECIRFFRYVNESVEIFMKRLNLTKLSTTQKICWMHLYHVNILRYYLEEHEYKELTLCSYHTVYSYFKMIKEITIINRKDMYYKFMDVFPYSIRKTNIINEHFRFIDEDGNSIRL